jgi:glycine dehydrogenase subunit 1
LLEKKIIGGFPLARYYPELGNAALWCCTELNSKEQIDTAVQAVGQ